MTLYCIQYAGKHGAGVVGPLKSLVFAEHRAEQLRATGEVETATVYPVKPWYEVREQYGIALSAAAARNSEYVRLRREGLLRVDAIGTHRRIQALMTLGWSVPRLEKAGGFRQWGLRDILKQRRVSRADALRVERLYDRLSVRKAPARTTQEKLSVSRTLTCARRNGYAVPMAWDDIDDPKARPVGMRRAA